jgi:hypothetical protein
MDSPLETQSERWPPAAAPRKTKEMSAIEASAQAPESPWRDEIRATLSLSWPMVLTNLAQVAMTATDVMLMGWAGPQMLAAGALGSNLYFAPLIFGLGLITATSPMMARELGRNRHSVRDVRRTGRVFMSAGCNGRCCPSTAISCCAPSYRRSSDRAGRWSSW